MEAAFFAALIGVVALAVFAAVFFGFTGTNAVSASERESASPSLGIGMFPVRTRRRAKTIQGFCAASSS